MERSTANDDCFYKKAPGNQSFRVLFLLAGAGFEPRPVAVPEKIFGLSLSSIFSTAATRSAPFIRHRRRSHRSPPGPEVAQFRLCRNKKIKSPTAWWTILFLVAGAGFEPTVRVGTKALPCTLFVQSQVPAQLLRSLLLPQAALPRSPPVMIPPRPLVGPITR